MVPRLAESVGTARIFSESHLRQVEYCRTTHLRFCRRCRLGMEPISWRPHLVEGTECARCPECHAFDPPIALVEVDRFHALQRLAHVFVCSECGEEYATPPEPTPVPDAADFDENRTRQERLARYSHVWTAPCETCNKPTAPIRAAECISLPPSPVPARRNPNRRTQRQEDKDVDRGSARG